MDTVLAKKKYPGTTSWIGSLIGTLSKHRTSYLFLLPFMSIFILFTIVPVLISIGMSFTYYNILEPPKWIGWKNYINLFVADDVFLIAVKNTFIFVLISGPFSLVASLIFAWLINEFWPKVRALMVTIFYAPAIAGQVYMIWTILFSGDSYGYINGLLIRLGIVDEPVQWLTDTRYMLAIVIIVSLWMSLGQGFLAIIAGLQGVPDELYEAGLMDGIRNRWQELWFITLPGIKPQLMFAAVMSTTQSFAVYEVSAAMVGFPSTDYAAHTVVAHLIDYGSIRFEMGYASAIATILFVVMVLSNKFVQYILKKLGR